MTRMKCRAAMNLVGGAWCAVLVSLAMGCKSNKKPQGMCDTFLKRQRKCQGLSATKSQLQTARAQCQTQGSMLHRWAQACGNKSDCSAFKACIKEAFVRTMKQKTRKSPEQLRRERQKRAAAARKKPPARPLVRCSYSHNPRRYETRFLKPKAQRHKRERCYIRLASEPFSVSLRFQGKSGTKITVNGQAKTIPEGQSTVSFALDFKSQFYQKLAQVKLAPMGPRDRTKKFPLFGFDLTFTMTHPKHDPRRGRYRISGVGMLRRMLKTNLEQGAPTLLPGEDKGARASGKVALMVASTRLYYVTRRGGTFRDVKKVMKSIKYPTRRRRCGPYVGARTGRRKYYYVEYNDLLEGIYQRTTGRRIGRKRFRASGRCPRRIKYGRAPSYSYSSRRYYRWLARQSR